MIPPAVADQPNRHLTSHEITNTMPKLCQTPPGAFARWKIPTSDLPYIVGSCVGHSPADRLRQH